MASPNVAAGQDSEIPALEDISEEEVETARASKSNLTLLSYYLFIFFF